MIFALTIVLAQISATPLPSPTPTPDATGTPMVAVGGAVTAYGVKSGGDGGGRIDFSNALLHARAVGHGFAGQAYAGCYTLSTLGFAVTPSCGGTNVGVYSALPALDISYAPAKNVTLTAGKLMSMVGAEAPFTFLNQNIERGVVFGMTPVISRAVRGAYANGSLTAALEVNDAYYGLTSRALEGSLAYTFHDGAQISGAFIAPQHDAPPNAGTSVGNKDEWYLSYSATLGKLSLQPYLVFVHSPSSPTLGYFNSEDADGYALLAREELPDDFSVAFRYEDAVNHSSAGDASPNADLVGFGAGSRAQTLTLTPGWQSGAVLVRLEFSDMHANTGLHETRYVLEAGLLH